MNKLVLSISVRVLRDPATLLSQISPAGESEHKGHGCDILAVKVAPKEQIMRHFYLLHDS